MFSFSGNGTLHLGFPLFMFLLVATPVFVKAVVLLETRLSFSTAYLYAAIVLITFVWCACYSCHNFIVEVLWVLSFTLFSTRRSLFSIFIRFVVWCYYIRVHFQSIRPEYVKLCRPCDDIWKKDCLRSQKRKKPTPTGVFSRKTSTSLTIKSHQKCWCRRHQFEDIRWTVSMCWLQRRPRRLKSPKRHQWHCDYNSRRTMLTIWIPTQAFQ